MSPQAVVSGIDVAKAAIQAYNDKNWNNVRALTSPDAAYDEISTNRTAHGIDEILAVYRGWATAFPDSRATFESTVAEGSRVVVELTWRGTHSGPLRTPRGEIAPTGRKIEVRACEVIELSGDKVKTMRHYFDMVTLLEQIGATR